MNPKAPIYTEKAECRDCYKCVRNCPVKAIKVEQGHASVMTEMCIYCGNCVNTCPVKAKKVRNDLEVFHQAVQEGQKIIFSIAPSLAPEFFGSDLPRQLQRAVPSLLGFSETALGADVITSQVVKLVQEFPKKTWISTACPVVVQVIQKYRSHLCDNLTPLPSPLGAHCQLLKQKLGEDVRVIFIGPCIAKKIEADTQKGLIHAVLTMENIQEWLKEQNLSSTSAEIVADKVDAPLLFEPSSGLLYPLEGGMIRSIRQKQGKLPIEGMSFSGMAQVLDVLDELGMATFQKPCFLELLACQGGCINGPCMYSGRQLFRHQAVEQRFKQHAVEHVATVDEFAVSPCAWQPLPVWQTTPDDHAIEQALNSVGKYTIEDHLNCGGCGYDSCRDFAMALVNKTAETEMCVSYNRQLAQKKANALIQALPSSVVLVNQDLNVVDCNLPFAKLVQAETQYELQPGLEGAHLSRLLPFSSLFQEQLKEKAKIINREIRWENKIVDITLFTIDPGCTVGAVIRDITDPAVKKERIIEKTRQVIQKNLETVQSIAYLLGENASETEVILCSIIEHFNDAKSADSGE